jgi:ferrous iron transport protein B
MQTAAVKTEERKLIVALAGNPNAGKTTLFNALTGLRQKVANYPGVTVERKEGVWQMNGNGSHERAAQLIDLPGLYSLDASSIDEQIARDVLTGKIKDLPAPDVIVAVVDATNLERNLYLVTQVLEYGIPVVVALTMMDIAEKNELQIDTEKLSLHLGAPVIAVTAAKNIGIEEISKQVSLLSAVSPQNHKFDEIKLIAEENKKIFARYNFISAAVQESVVHKNVDEVRRSEKIDRILTHKVWGLLILGAILLLVFQTIFSWAALPMDLLDKGFGELGQYVKDSLPPGILTDLLTDGIIAGVGGILVFLPQILLLFFFLSVLEDTGYMTRAAFLLDRLMRGVGLHGKAFLPLLSSFACAIPGIMATRTIESPKDRIATIMIAPLMSCSARLPVYTLMIAAFFSGQFIFGFLSVGAVIMLSMYVLGIVTAIVMAFILKRSILKAPPPPLVMELPPYRLPNIRTVLLNMFQNGWVFVKRAGTVILAISILLWALTAFPRQAAEPDANATTTAAAAAELESQAPELTDSYAGQLGKVIEPSIRPLGFDWKMGVALIASFAAREVLVSTLSILYNVDKDSEADSPSLIEAVRDAKNDSGAPAWTPLTALTMMVFFVLACQCMSTVAVVRRETNSWRWPLFMVAYMTILAYVGAFITYQGGKLLGLDKLLGS